MGVELQEQGILGLPSKFSSYRGGQSAAISSIFKDYSLGKKFVVSQMPTGTGKTFIAMAVKQLLEVPTIYVCTTKSLQDQFVTDFPSARLIKGRANYPCGRVPQKFPDLTADDCMGDSCLASCPYKAAKEDARKADLVVTNTAYYLNEIRYAKQFAGRGLVVIDEADTLEDMLLDQVSVQITEYDVEKMSLGRPVFKTKWEEWKVWAEKTFVAMRAKEQDLQMELKNYDSEEKWETAPVKLIRDAKFTSRLVGKLGFFLKAVDKNWVWEQGEGKTRAGAKYWKWIFKPIRVDQFGDIVWKSGDRFLMMSATILNNKQYERNVGLFPHRQEEDSVDYIEVDSTFPAERRQVKIVPGVDITAKKIDENLPALVEAAARICADHAREKGVVHAVSYRVGRAIADRLGSRAVFHDPSTRAAAIKRFKESTSPLVLVSPSVERGEDFPDDICRFIVIVKLPYPYLGDPRISRRLYLPDGQKWYNLKTVSKLIQMTGRGMRHEEDSCVSYILDPGFGRLYTSLETRSMFPKWWRDSVIDLTEGGVDRAKKEGDKTEEGEGGGGQQAPGGPRQGVRSKGGNEHRVRGSGSVSSTTSVHPRDNRSERDRDPLDGGVKGENVQQRFHRSPNNGWPS